MKKLVSSKIKSQALAIMWGDAFVDCNHNSGKARLDIYHSKTQLDLLLQKQEILESITGVTCVIKEKNDNRPLLNGKTREGYRLQTNFTRYIYKLEQAPFKYVAKRLVTPEALALLWASDGTLCIRQSGNYIGSFASAVLCTDSWEIWQVEEFKKQWNKQYGWCPTLTNYACRGKNYPRLRLIKSQAELLSDTIIEHTVESMKYKLLPSKTLETL